MHKIKKWFCLLMPFSIKLSFHASSDCVFFETQLKLLFFKLYALIVLKDGPLFIRALCFLFFMHRVEGEMF